MAAIVQAYDIPLEIELGLAKGLYKVWGGVVRWAVGPNKGQIVTHLKPIDIAEVANSARVDASLAKKALNIVKNNKKTFIIGTIAFAVVSAGAGTIYYVTHKKSKEELEFRLALKKYIDAVREGALQVNTIDTLVSTMEVLKTCKNYEEIKLELSTQDLDILINHIREFTVQLANDNNVELCESETEDRGKNEDNMIYLKRYLNTQRRILSEAA